MKRPVRLKGVAASTGIAVGPARVIGREHREPSHHRIDEAEIGSELARFELAVSKSRAEIDAAKRTLMRQHGSAYAPILDVYLLMHRDALLIDAIAEAIRRDAINAEWALSRVAERLKKPLLEDASSYFRERARDIEHVQEHLLRHLRGELRTQRCSEGPSVLIAHDLTPADAVHMLAPPTVALVTESGAGSSHTAILARTFGVPAVVGIGPLPVDIRDAEVVVVDGFSGEVTVGASAAEGLAAEARRDRFTEFLRSERSTTAVTGDGVCISVTANLELPSEARAALDNGAEGIGLYRTEFMCLDRAQPPSEDEQLEVYREVVETLAPKKVVFRTFDWRGDKRPPAHDLDHRERSWLKTQVKALLRASADGPIALMFPMVATVDELREARDLVEHCRSELGMAGAGSDVPIGMMVEVPSAALLVERFAEHADFFAVGTNDLAHSTLAFDRGDGRRIADPLEPAVLLLLDRIISAADQAKVPCSMCGDMAADPFALGVALGLGYREISVPVSVVPLVRAVVRNIDLGAAEEVAREALRCDSARAVRALVAERLNASLGALWNESVNVSIR